MTLTPRLWLWFMCPVNFSWYCWCCLASPPHVHLPQNFLKAFFKNFWKKRSGFWGFCFFFWLLKHNHRGNCCFCWRVHIKLSCWHSAPPAQQPPHSGVSFPRAVTRAANPAEAQKNYPQRRRTPENPDVPSTSFNSRRSDLIRRRIYPQRAPQHICSRIQSLKAPALTKDSPCKGV